jgi:hypothetical protein
VLFVCNKGMHFFLPQTCIIYDNVVAICLCFEKENALFKISWNPYTIYSKLLFYFLFDNGTGHVAS